MTVRAAGLMIHSKAGNTLFVRRANTGEWAFPGGYIKDGETAEDAARREADEEIGRRDHGALRHHMQRVKGGVDFTTFRAEADEEFVPELDAEHTEHAWAPADDPPRPLHPGAAVALRRGAMDELAIARAISEDDLVSPQRYGNLYLFAIRITGTGLAYRDGRKEYAWRDPADYLTDEFLARCNGLPVVWDHPTEKPALDSEEFNKRVVGTVFLPYKRGYEVWAVAKIYDAPTVELMLSQRMSTSPAVVFRDLTSTNEKRDLPDGSTLLIEGRPALLDHIALCERGVWDKGGAPSGVDASGALDMADDKEDKAAADKARHDAEDVKMDAIMDAFKRMDARLDAMDKERKDAARFDSARKDKFGPRRDGESYKDYVKRHDGDERKMNEDMRRMDSERSEEDCSMDSKRARKDAEDEEKRHDKDFEKWAKEEEKEPEHAEDKKARKDAEAPEDVKEEKKEEKAEEEEEAPKDAARKDSAAAKENAELRLRLSRAETILKGLTAEVSRADVDALAQAQVRADGVAAMFGDRATPPLSGETPLDYRRRLLARFRKHSPQFKETRFDGLDAHTLELIEDRVYADAMASARQTGEVTVGQLIPTVTRENGRDITRFYGDVGAFMEPFVPSSMQLVKMNRNPKGTH